MLGVAVLAVAWASCTQNATLSGDKLAPVKIGLITSLTGGLASLGPGWRDTALVAEQEVNAAGGPVPGRHAEFLVRDDATDGNHGQMAAQELVQQDGVVAIIGAAASSVSLKVADVTYPAHIPQISCCSTSDLLTDAQPTDGDRYFFRTVSPDGGLQAPVLARTAYDQLMCTHLAIAHLGDAYGQPFGEQAETSFRALGGTVVANLVVEDALDTYGPTVTMLQAAHPDCIALVMYDSGGVLLREWHSMGGDPAVKFIGGDGTKTPGFIENVTNRAYLSAYLGTAPYTEADSRAHTRFFQAFDALFGMDPDIGLFPSAQYDAAALVLLATAQAAQTTGGVTGQAIRDALYQVSARQEAERPVEQLAEALEQIRAGQNIDYSGASGPVDLNQSGYVITSYEVWRYDMTTDGFVTDHILSPSEIMP